MKTQPRLASKAVAAALALSACGIVPYRLDRPQNAELEHEPLNPPARPRAYTIVGHQHQPGNQQDPDVPPNLCTLA